MVGREKPGPPADGGERGRPEWVELCRLVGEAVGASASRHPGAITESVVEAVTARYRIEPRRTHHRERRWNHAERIRRLSHSVFRALEETGGREPANRIAEDILGAFSLAPGGVEEIG